MQNEKSTRRGQTQHNQNAVVKQSVIAELVSASSTHAVTQVPGKQQAWKTLKQVQGLCLFDNNREAGDPRLGPLGMTFNLMSGSRPTIRERMGCLLPPPEGEDARRADEGETEGTGFAHNPGLTPHPGANAHGPLPQGARGTTRGFTLIELLVVVLIIGLLAAVALPQYQKAVYKAQGREALQFIDTLDKALQAYYLQNSSLAGFNDTTTTIDLPELKHFTFNGGAKLDIGTGNYLNLNLINETGEVAIRSLVGCTYRGWLVPPQPWICTLNLTSGIHAYTKPTRTCADYFDCPGITATHVDVGSRQWWEYDQPDCIIK